MSTRARRAGPRGPRAPRDPYGIGPAVGLIAPALAVVALVVIASVTFGLFNGQLPVAFRGNTGSNGNQPRGPAVTPAPSNVVIVEPEVAFPGSIAYAKAGNIWIQTGTRRATAHQHRQRTRCRRSRPTASGSTSSGSPRAAASSRIGGHGQRTWYDLETPSLMRRSNRTVPVRRACSTGGSERQLHLVLLDPPARAVAGREDGRSWSRMARTRSRATSSCRASTWPRRS